MRMNMDLFESFGGADIIIAGMGSDGHIGLNSQGSRLDIREQGRLKRVRLTDEIIRSNIKDYPGITDNPFAYTMSLYDIVLAEIKIRKYSFLLVNGEDNDFIRSCRF